MFEGKYQNALDNYKLSLGKLVPLLSQEPKGQRRDLLHQQVTIANVLNKICHSLKYNYFSDYFVDERG